MKEPWYFRGRTSRLGWFGKLSWLGRLNYYVLQWFGIRLAAIVEPENEHEHERVIGWKFVREPAGKGWIR